MRPEQELRSFAGIFGRMLLPRGFFLYGRAFWRVREDMLWVVGMNEAGVIGFQIIHFCHGLSGELPQSGLWQLVTVMPKGSVYSLDAAAHFFREDLLEDFVSVEGMGAFQAFRSRYWMQAGVPEELGLWRFDEMWECLYMKHYDRAEELLQRTFKQWQERIAAKPELCEEPFMRARGEEYLTLLTLFSEENRDALDQRVQRNMDVVRSACRERFGTNIL